MYKRAILIFIFLTGLSWPMVANSATIMNGGVTVFDEESPKGKLEICPAIFGTKEYKPPSNLEVLVSPIENITSVIQIPVALVRGPERGFVQATSDSRNEMNPCLNYRLFRGDKFDATFDYKNVNLNSNVSIDTMSVDVSISRDTTSDSE